MKEEISQLIVNNYANHVLPDREWTAEEREGMNQALRKYGWTDTKPEVEVKKKREFSIQKRINQNTFCHETFVTFTNEDGKSRQLNVRWSLETEQDVKWNEAVHPGVDFKLDMRKIFQEELREALPDITPEEFEDFWKLTPFK